jgi:radical SAM superfamily enzyme YgiQ (UPF0313 family)
MACLGFDVQVSWRYNAHMENKGHALLLNPWIYDFAAHNQWIEPLGLLTIAATLLSEGYDVTVIDCLAPHPGAPRPRPDGSGKFLKVVVPKPGAVAFVPRYYGRYGKPLEQFNAELAAVPCPDVVMVASGMTYWYPGIIEAIQQVRTRFGAVPVALGGVYATLCPDHARQHSGADRVVVGPGVVAALRFADEVTGHNCDLDGYVDPRAWPRPAHERVPRPLAGVVTSWGCPYRCTYCADRWLQPVFVRRRPSTVVEEIVACARRGIGDIAFYDDALLLDAEQHLVPILEGVLAQGVQVRFHTPNGMHAREITAEVATLMRRARFATVRLSLETTDAPRQRHTGAKVTTDVFEQAAANLRMAGFGSRELGAYILAGLPGQPLSEVEATVRFVQGLGVQAKLALFSPIPGTPDGDQALPPGTDPLLHNNTVYPYLLGDKYVRDLQRIKDLAKLGNASLIRDG